MQLPAGTYFIGDPCYCFSHDTNSWERVGDLANGFEDFGKVMTLDGHPFFAACTWYGDGEYEDEWGNKYPVDAGLLGAVPEALWERSREELQACGRIVTFNVPFTVGGGRESGSAVVQLGATQIDTDPDWQEEDDDC